MTGITFYKKKKKRINKKKKNWFQCPPATSPSGARLRLNIFRTRLF